MNTGESSSEMRPADNTSQWQFYDYKVIGQHGHAQLGTVSGYGRVWFVKSLTRECRDMSECRRALTREYDILLKLHDGPVAQVAGLHEIEGAGLSIVMEYIDGEHLDQYLSHADSRRRKVITRKLVEAVAFLHSRSVNHLDLKPENIMISGSVEDPEIRLIDFNLSESAVYDMNRSTGGNRRYAAPEQLASGFKGNPRADVWSLGLLLKEINPGGEWQKVIAKSLERDPQKRPEDASRMLAMVDAAKKTRKTIVISALSIAIPTILVLAGYFIFIHNDAPRSSDDNTEEYWGDEENTSSGDEETEERIDKSSTTGIENNAMNGEDQSGRFARYEKERLELIPKAKIIINKYLKECRAICEDKTKTALQRKTLLNDVSMKGPREVNQLFIDFRDRCPEELLKEKPEGWTSPLSTELKEDLGNYSLEVIEMQKEIKSWDWEKP